MRLSAQRFAHQGPSEPVTAQEGAQWPSVPYSALSVTESLNTMDTLSQADGRDAPASPPRIAFNGVSTEPPKGASNPRSRSGTISNESLARQREQDELYPPLMPPAMLKPKRDGSDSPIIPLSPDPFGRFPTEAEATRIQVEQGSDSFYESRPRSASRPPLPQKMSYDPETRAKSQTPSSRFSLDSAISEEESEKSAKATPLVSMKSIKKLWRKTNSKLSLSGASAGGLESGRSSPNDPREQRRMSRQSTKSPQLSDHQGDSPPKLRKRKSSVRSMQLFAGDVPRQPSPAMPASAMASSSFLPPLSASPSPSPNSSPQMQYAVPAAERNGSVRKSILKSWKSANGSLAAQNAQAAASPQTTPRSSQELLQDAGMKRRRPSLVDGSTVGMRRGSVLSAGSATLVDIPPSPALPEEFAQAQVRKRSSQSNLLNSGTGRRMSTRQRLSPSMSSMSTISSSPPRQNGRLTPGDSPPKGGSLSTRISGESTESRPSFDVSQFEIVSPKQNSFKLATQLSYPYHGLDQSE